MCNNFHFWWIMLFVAVKCSTSGSRGDLIRYESLPPLHWILNRGLPQPSLRPQGLPMLPYQSDSLAPPELRALTTYVTVTSIVSQCRLPLQETLDSFQTAKSVTKHVSWWICLAPKKKSQISCRYPPTEVSESLAPSPFKKRNPSLPEKLEARQLAGAGCKSGRSGPWLISPGKTFSIICVTLTLEQKHDPIPRVARSDR